MSGKLPSYAGTRIAFANDARRVFAGVQPRSIASSSQSILFAEPLPAGTEVTIGEARGEWTRVVLADRSDAWVSAAAVRAVSTSDAPID